VGAERRSPDQQLAHHAAHYEQLARQSSPVPVAAQERPVNLSSLAGTMPAVRVQGVWGVQSPRRLKASC
jgi:hypothetical protein